MGLKGEDMKRYRKLTTRIPRRDKAGYGAIDVDNKMIEHPDGEWVKREDVKGIENLGFKSHGGYIQTKGIVTDMAASLH